MARLKRLVALTWVVFAASAEGNPNLDGYLAELAEKVGQTGFSSARGEALWFTDYDGRRCTSCHLDSIFAAGRHQKTGKVIEPMAPSANPKRLTDAKKMKKWFLRNCKWTLGRECTALEKGDVLVWLRAQ